MSGIDPALRVHGNTFGGRQGRGQQPVFSRIGDVDDDDGGIVEFGPVVVAGLLGTAFQGSDVGVYDMIPAGADLVLLACEEQLCQAFDGEAVGEEFGPVPGARLIGFTAQRGPVETLHLIEVGLGHLLGLVPGFSCGGYSGKRHHREEENQGSTNETTLAAHGARVSRDRRADPRVK